MEDKLLGLSGPLEVQPKIAGEVRKGLLVISGRGLFGLGGSKGSVVFLTDRCYFFVIFATSIVRVLFLDGD